MATLLHDRFPRSNRYHPDWVVARGSGGANALWLTEWLAEALDLRPGMRVLDLGCGKASSSVFLHREFGVEVWAVDLWFAVDQNLRCMRDAGVEKAVHPIHADARSLPFEAEFFDAVLAIDSYQYFGTDDLYTHYITRLLKPGGWLAIAGAGLTREFDGQVPAALRRWWEPIMCCLHSHAWWRKHWERSGVLDVIVTDEMQNAWQYWLEWQHIVAPDNAAEIEALERDAGNWLTYHRAIGRRRSGVAIDAPLLAVPTTYQRHPLCRDERVEAHELSTSR